MSKFTDSPADVCDDAFKSAYATTYAALHNAKSRFDRTRNGKRAMALSIDSLQPKQVRTCPFWNVLPVHIQTIVKMIYDVSITGRAGLVDTLYHSAVEYGTCSWVAESGINKYHICDLEVSKISAKPVSSEDWNVLLRYVQGIVHSKKLDAIALHRHKRTKVQLHQGSTSSNQQMMERAVMEGNQNILGTFAACYVWFLETKNMNRSYESQNSIAGSTVYNTSSLLCRKKPIVIPPKPTPVTVEAEPEVEEKEVDVTPDDWEEVDNWEDLV